MSSMFGSLAVSRYRWVICALLFCATTSNYMDRQILGILAPELQRQLGWSELEYGHIVTAFQAAYALGLLLCGWLVDRLGSRWGLILAVAAWSVACAAHGLAANALQFALARFGLGLAEAGNFPASIKSVAEWFPTRERALAIGIFNSGSNIGAIAAPLIVPIVAVTWGWRAAFYLLGVVGCIWVGAALVFFRPPRGDQSREQSLGQSPRQSAGQGSSQQERACTLRRALSMRETWAFALAKFLTDPVWWFYLYWTPKYLFSNFTLDLMSLGAPLVTIYVAADVGSIGGGWWSGYLARRGIPESEARMKVMLCCATMVVSVVGLAYAANLWLAVLLLSLATAAHQGWSANLFASVCTLVPRDGVALVVGIGGMAGAIGGMIFAQVTGHLLQTSGSYLPLFITCAAVYLIAWGAIRLIVGNVSGRDRSF